MAESVRCEGFNWEQIKKPVSFWSFHLPLLGLLAILPAYYLAPVVIKTLGSVIFWVLWGCGLSVGFELPFFIRRNIVGNPIYFWLDKHGILQIRQADWWVNDGERAFPSGPILKIWFGGWFRKDQVIENNGSDWAIFVTFGFFSGRIRDVILRDRSGNFVRINGILTRGASVAGTAYFWNTATVESILRVIDGKSNVLRVLRDATPNNPTVLKVGAQAS